MKKVYLLILAALASLLFSCASGTNQTDDSVGYITFGSSRAGLSSFGKNVSNLTNLELTGTHGGSTKQLGSWSTAGEAEGTEIEVQAGSWTLTLKANINSQAAYFLSTKTVTIKPGTTNSVSFVMEYVGFPASQAVTGDVIFSNGYAESPSSSYYTELRANSTPEAIAVVSGGTVYGVSLTIGSQVNSNSIASSTPAGWSIPDFTTLGEIYNARDTIASSLESAGSTNYLSSRSFWSSDIHETDGQLGISFSGGTRVAPGNLFTYYYILPIKTY